MTIRLVQKIKWDKILAQAILLKDLRKAGLINAGAPELWVRVGAAGILIAIARKKKPTAKRGS